jgi:hypothetical protein
VWESVKVPEGTVLMPGVIRHATNVVEHPELLAERLARPGDLDAFGRAHTDLDLSCVEPQRGCYPRRRSGAKIGIGPSVAGLDATSLWWATKRRSCSRGAGTWPRSLRTVSGSTPITFGKSAADRLATMWSSGIRRVSWLLPMASSRVPNRS